MNIAFKEVNQDGELILNDKYGDDIEITESGIVDCTEIKINKTTVLTSGRVLQNVTLGALPSLSVDQITIDGDTISNSLAADINLTAAKVNLNSAVNITGPTDFKNSEIKDPSKITVKNGAIIEGNSIKTATINTSLLVDGNLHGVKLGSEFSSPITFVKFSSCLPKNDVGTNLNCLPMTFKLARMEQIHSCVNIFGNQIINITSANQLTEFKFRMVDSVFIQTADFFYGHGYITNAVSGESSHFGAEITRIDPPAEIRFKGLARTAGEHVFTFYIRYTTTNFTNGA